jgi:hypothetical protein
MDAARRADVSVVKGFFSRSGRLGRRAAGRKAELEKLAERYCVSRPLWTSERLSDTMASMNPKAFRPPGRDGMAGAVIQKE